MIKLSEKYADLSKKYGLNRTLHEQLLLEGYRMIGSSNRMLLPRNDDNDETIYQMIRTHRNVGIHGKAYHIAHIMLKRLQHNEYDMKVILFIENSAGGYTHYWISRDNYIELMENSRPDFKLNSYSIPLSSQWGVPTQQDDYVNYLRRKGHHRIHKNDKASSKIWSANREDNQHGERTRSPYPNYVSSSLPSPTWSGSNGGNITTNDAVLLYSQAPVTPGGASGLTFAMSGKKTKKTATSKKTIIGEAPPPKYSNETMQYIIAREHMQDIQVDPIKNDNPPDPDILPKIKARAIPTKMKFSTYKSRNNDDENNEL